MRYYKKAKIFTSFTEDTSKVTNKTHYNIHIQWKNIFHVITYNFRTHLGSVNIILVLQINKLLLHFYFLIICTYSLLKLLSCFNILSVFCKLQFELIFKFKLQYYIFVIFFFQIKKSVTSVFVG